MDQWRGPQYEGEFPSLGWDIVDWIEKNLCHGPGDVHGEPIELDDEFIEFIVRAYAIDSITGKRRIRRAFLSRSKGRAKSELAGMLVCAEACGPVRFSHWDENGDPVGRPVRSPFIRCLATEEGQSGNTYDNVSTMMGHLAERRPDLGIDIGRAAHSSSRVIIQSTNGVIEPSTAANSSKDGGKETFAVFDETHLYTSRNLHWMHETVRRNLRKRLDAEPWCLETSTMYRPGDDSVAEATHKFHQRIASGEIQEKGLLFDHKQAPLETDLADRESLLAGLKEAYGPAAAWMDLDGIISEIWDPQSDPSDSRRYWLNQVVSSSDSWIASDEWARCEHHEIIADGETITLGFDGSRNEDSTALIACRVSDGLLQPVHVWEKPLHSETWQVDRDHVDALVYESFSRFNVVGFYADPAHWQDYCDKWNREFADRLQVKSSNERPIEWWTHKTSKMILALERFHEATVDGSLKHNGDTVLTTHILNAKRRYSRVGMTISKEHPHSHRKIDAAMAATLAYECRSDAVASGATGDKRRSRRMRRI